MDLCVFDLQPWRKFIQHRAEVTAVMVAMTGMAGTDAMHGMHGMRGMRAMVEERRDTAVTGAVRAETSGDMRTAIEAAITMTAHRLQRTCLVFGQKFSVREGTDNRHSASWQENNVHSLAFMCAGEDCRDCSM